MTRASSRAVVCLVAVLCMSGCAFRPLAMNYRPEPATGDTAIVTQTLVVVVEPDQRPFKGRSRLGPGFLALIPLVPYAHQQISPDLYLGQTRARRRDFRYELADTIVADLRAAHVARRVLLPEDFPSGEQPEASARYLRLTLREGILHRNFTTYGMSLAGVMLWFVGLPTSYGRVEIVLEAAITDGADHELGRTVLRGEASVTEFLYYPFPAASSRKLPDAYEQISRQLRPFVRNTLAATAPTA